MKLQMKFGGAVLLSLLLWGSTGVHADNDSTAPGKAEEVRVIEAAPESTDVIAGDQSEARQETPADAPPAAETTPADQKRAAAAPAGPVIPETVGGSSAAPSKATADAAGAAGPGQLASPGPATPAVPGTGTVAGKGKDLAPSGRGKGDEGRFDRVQYFEQEFRGLMTNTGVTEFEVQNAILVYIQEDAQARLPLKRLGARLLDALRDNVTDADLATIFDAYRAAVDADKARREAAQAALDAQIGYGVKPRLESMLMLFGIIGDGPALIPLSQPSRPRKGKSPSNPVKVIDHRRLPTFGQLQTFLDGIEPEIVEDVTIGKLQSVWRTYDKDRNGEIDAQEKAAAVEFLTQDFRASKSKTTVVAAPPIALPSGASSYLPINGDDTR